MNQTEREYREAMDGLRFSDEAKERMMKNLMEQRGQEPAKRRSIRPLRTALIAAAACLALVGTAFAATTVYRLTAQLYSEREEWGNVYDGYRIYGEPIAHPIEDFSQQFQDDFAAWDHPTILFNRHFGTWEEARAYLGDDIPITWYDMDVQTDEYRIMSYYEPYGDGKLKRVDVYNNAQIGDNMSCTTEIRIYAPDYPFEWLAGRGDFASDQVDFEMLDRYTMANGCEAEIILETKRYEKDGYHEEGDMMRYCNGVFMKEGLVYDVELTAYMNCTLDDTEVEARMHEILDSFE